MEVVASDFNVKGTGSVGTVVLCAASLAVIVSGFVLKVIVALDSSTASTWGFFLGGRSSSREQRFRLGC